MSIESPRTALSRQPSLEHGPRAVRSFIDGVHRLLAVSPFDRLLSRVNGALPPSFQEHARRVVAQPHSYPASVTRRARREGLDLELSPHDYFQWHQFYRFGDEVLVTLRAAAAGASAVIDVGANIGFYGLLVARAIAPAGRVYCCEPNPSTAEKLRRHRDENRITNVEIVEAAVGATSGHITLYDHGDGEPGKFSARAPSGGRSVEVRLVTLDALVLERAIGRVQLVKADVEGLEPDVILGAKALIGRDRPMLCLEITPRWLAQRPAETAEAFTFLAAQEYRYFHILPAPAKPGSLRAIDIGPLVDPSTGARIAGGTNVIAVAKGGPLPAGLFLVG